MKIYDVIIVGSGPAGMTAAIYAKRANLDVLLLDKLAPGGQIINTYEIQNYPGFSSVNGADLAMQVFEHTQALGIEFDYGTVEKIETEEREDGGCGTIKIVTCAEGKTYRSLAVILATGTKPRMLHVPNELDFAGKSISWCAICDGAKYRDKSVIVIGGGNSAVEESIYLAEMAKKVTVVTMLALTADPMACDKLKSLPNVEVYEWFDIKEFLPGAVFTGLRAVSSKTGEEIVVYGDGAFEYIGLQPVTEPFAGLGILESHGYIEANERMETAVPGIFGAGDSNSKLLRQIVTACSDGAVAAQSAAAYKKKCMG